MSKRIEEIHNKGFDISTPRSIPAEGIPDADYARIKVGIKSLDDAVVNLGAYRKLDPRMTKENI